MDYALKMDFTYSNACKEVITLFDYFLDENDFAKIPARQIEHIKKQANQQYIYIIDERKSLEEQKISKEAKAIIINIYKKYFVNAEKRLKIDQYISNIDRPKNIDKKTNVGFNSLEEALKYKNDEKNMEIHLDTTNEKSLVQSENIWQKIIRKILRIFHLK